MRFPSTAKKEEWIDRILRKGVISQEKSPAGLQFVQKPDTRKAAAVHKAHASDFTSSTLQAGLRDTILIHLQEKETS